MPSPICEQLSAFFHFHLNGIQHVHVGDSTQIKSGIEKKKDGISVYRSMIWEGGVFSQCTLK